MKKNTKNIMGIYIRVSDIKQVTKGISLNDQRKRGIELAKKIGWEYIVFEDAGLSGGLSFRERPALNELVERIVADEITGIYAIEIDRLSRDVTDGNILLSLLIEKKTKVFDYTGEIDFQDEGAEMIARIRLVFSDLLKRGIRRKVKRVLETNIAEGKTHGGDIIKFGYKKGPNNMLIVNDDIIEGTKFTERKVIELIFNMAYKGIGAYKIATALNELKIPTKRTILGKNIIINGKEYNNFLWCSTTILEYLNNTTYKGIRMYGPKGEQKPYPCPGIIDPVVFDSIQTALPTRKKYSIKPGEKFYLLKGLIECGVCGRKYYGFQTRGIGTYFCSSRQHGSKCSNRGFNVRDLNEIVINDILDLENIVNAVFDDKEFKVRTDSFKRKHITTVEKINELQQQKDRLFKLYAGGKIKESDIDKQIGSIDRLLDRLETLEKNQSKELVIAKEKDAILEVVKEGVAEFKKLKQFEDKAQFIRSILSSVELRWVDEKEADTPHYDIFINYKFDLLENYLICKTISVDRSSKKGAETAGKWFNKVLSQKVSLTNLLLVDNESNIDTISEINYTKYLQQHRMGYIKAKK